MSSLFGAHKDHLLHGFVKSSTQFRFTLDYLKGIKFLDFAVFDHFRKILHPRKVSKPQNR